MVMYLLWFFFHLSFFFNFQGIFPSYTSNIEPQILELREAQDLIYSKSV